MNARIASSPSPVVPSTPLSKLSEAEFCDWVMNARHGETLIYHVGYLTVDRELKNTALSSIEVDRIDRVASRAWDASKSGLVQLFSRKLGFLKYEYLAVRVNTWLRPESVRERLDKRQ